MDLSQEKFHEICKFNQVEPTEEKYNEYRKLYLDINMTSIMKLPNRMNNIFITFILFECI